MALRVRSCPRDRLERVLEEIDGRGYSWYRRRLAGCSFTIGGLRYTLARIQPDPYAPPSIVYVEGRVEAPSWALRYPVALADYLYRSLHRALHRYSARLGEGHSGRLSVPRPSNAMLRRSGLEVWADGRLVARLRVGLPSRRRRILGREASDLLLERLPVAIAETLRALGDVARLREHVDAWAVQEEIRAKLPGRGLVAFIGDGSILPRRCGDCEDPLPDAVPFESPPSLRVEIETSRGVVSGMGIPRGFTVIAGPAFHGKTTLLEAIQYGIYNHIPGDGRERVVSLRETVKVRAEDGRSITCVDVSTFILSIPGGASTECFTTADASGATSTAAAIQEAVEAGAKLLLVDEDTTATNILYYDERVENLMPAKTVRTISEQAHAMPAKGVSVVVVSSGSAPLIASADTVIVMHNYRAKDLTPEAQKLKTLRPTAGEYKPPRTRRLRAIPQLEKPRIRETWLTDPKLPQPINLDYNEQLVEQGQYNLLAALLRKPQLYLGKTMREIAELIDSIISTRGIAGLLGDPIGPEYTEVRGIDFTYLLNRLPNLKISQNPD